MRIFAHLGTTILVAAGLTAVTPWAALAAPAAASPPAMTVSSQWSGPDGGWDYVTFDAGRDRVYVARTYGVLAIDLASGKVTDHFADGARTHAVVVVPDSDLLLVTNGADNTARIISASDGSLKASVATGKGPDAAVYDPASKAMWVMDHAGGDITVIDPLNATVLATIPVGGALEFAAVDGKGRLYVNIEDKSEIAVVDTVSRTVVARYALPGCVEPSGLALTDAGLLIAACDNEVAAVVEAATGKLLARLTIGGGPDAVAYDRRLQRAYIPTSDDGKLWRIDLSKAGAKVVSSSPTQPSGRTAAVNTLTGEVYVPVAAYDPPAGAGQRPPQKPGSFKVMALKDN
jgi:DNA-binding beta-propeller fold protein YncE